MNKQELIEEISVKSGYSKSDVEKTLSAFAEVITEAVGKDDKVTLVGVGTFERSSRAARVGINPSTMEKIKIPARKVPKFKFAKSFKDLVAK